MDFETILAELFAKRTELIAANQAIYAASEEAGSLTDEQQTTFDANLAAIGVIDKKRASVEAMKKAVDATPAGTGQRTDPDKPGKNDLPTPEQEAAANAGGNIAATSGKPKIFAVPYGGGRVPSQFGTGEEARRRAYTCGRQLHAQLFGDAGADSARWCREHGIPIRAMTEGAPGGSLLVHTEFSQIIYDYREEYGKFRQLARRQGMASDAWSGTVQTGGITAYPVGEAQSGTASEPTFKPVTLNAKYWQTETPYTRELSNDSFVGLPDLIGREIAIGMAYAEDNAGINGDGTSTYHGIQGIVTKIDDGNYADSIVTAPTGDTSFGELIQTTFETAMGRLSDIPGINPVWLISKPGWTASMVRLVNSAGGNTASIIEGRRVQEFLGYPVVFINTMLRATSAQVNQIACLYGDLSFSTLFGDREGLEILSDPYTLMSSRQINLYGTERFDINNHSLGQTREGNWVTPMVAIKFPGS